MKRIGLIIAFIFCAAISYGQQIHSGGINIATGFKLNDPQPIDDRYVVQDSLSLLSIPNIYTGLWAYSLEDSSVFVFDGVKWERIVDMELAMSLISTFPKDTNTLNEVLAKGGSITADREIVSANRDLGFMSFDEFVINANSVTMDVNDSVLVKVNGKGVSVKEDSVEINVRTKYKDAYTFVNDRDLPDAGWVKNYVDSTAIFATVDEMMAYNGQSRRVFVSDSLRGGVFVLKPNGTPDSGIVFAGQNGYWHRLIAVPSIVRPEWWGAVGDGVTDNTRAIHLATAAQLRGYGNIVHFGEGIFVTQTCRWRDGTIYEGEGRGRTTIKWIDSSVAKYPTTSDNLFAREVKGTSFVDVEIRNMTIDGNYQNQAGRYSTINLSARKAVLKGLTIINGTSNVINVVTGCKQFEMYDVKMYGCQQSDASNATALVNISQSAPEAKTIIDNCHFADSATVTSGLGICGVNISKGYDGENLIDVSITRSKFHGLGLNNSSRFLGALAIYSGVRGYIGYNEFTNSRYIPIAVQNSWDVTVEGNVILNFDASNAPPLAILYQPFVRSWTGTQTSCIIRDNKIKQWGGLQAIGIGGSSATQLVSNVIISGNIVDTCATGVGIGYSKNVTVVNNTINATVSTFDINNNPSAANIDIVGNTVLGSPTQAIKANSSNSGSLNVSLNKFLNTGSTYNIWANVWKVVTITNNHFPNQTLFALNSDTTVIVTGNTGTETAPTISVPSAGVLVHQLNSWSVPVVTYDAKSTQNIYASSVRNVSSINNSQIILGSNGATIQRNIADANAALTVTQAHASSTGPLLDLKNSSSTVFKVSQSGKIDTYPGANANGKILVWNTSTSTFDAVNITNSNTVTATNGAGSITLNADTSYLATQSDLLNATGNTTTVTASGDGTSSSVDIVLPFSATWVMIGAKSEDAGNIKYWTVSGTDLTIYYDSPPAAGTNNLEYWIQYK